MFVTAKSEGAILPGDLLQKIVEGGTDIEGLSPESYHLAKTERLNEAATRAWNRLQGTWETFKSSMDSLPQDDAGTTLTRERWLLILFQELGYGRLLTHKAIEIEGHTYPISHMWQQTPIHLVTFRQELDRRTPGARGAARVSPHSLVQEFLNRSDDHLWGIVSNGLKLRILRDNASFTRPAYVEFDLQAMMDNEAYSDFFLLFLLGHQSRVEIPEGKTPEHCWLEKWHNAAAQQGIRALDQLRDGVQKAIEALGAGFIAHPANAELRDLLRTGRLTTLDYYRQVLRQIYRLLFLFVAEDRTMLFAPDSSVSAQEIYTKYYSTQRLRTLAGKKRGTTHPDLFRVLRLVFEKLKTGCSELALPALGGFLFGPDSTADLSEADIANYDLLTAIRHLAFTVEGHTLMPINYRDLGPEEFGSVYESLLEMHPQVSIEAKRFALDVAVGSERKTTGSYYTPSSLVNCLLDSALEPIIDQAIKKKPSQEAEQALLKLKICDPACGSGHFLISAAHRIAKHLAAIRAGEEEPAPESIAHALRDVIGHCIYGVDLNPMAVELCKVSLWIEALEPGKPLSFLDHHIKCGNSLLGTTPALMEKGIPNNAFKPIEGDDKALCQEFKRQNRDERKGQAMLFYGTRPWDKLGNLPSSMMTLDEMPDDTIQAIEHKQKRYAEIVGSTTYKFGRLLADTWCAAFVWKKTKDFDYPITEKIFREIEANPHNIAPWMEKEVTRLAKQYQFLHWHLEFPDVFRVPTEGESPENEQAGWSGGFSCILGNPPWEKLQCEEQGFFASYDLQIANATGAGRKKMIRELEKRDPKLFTNWLDYRRFITTTVALLKCTGRYPLTGVGKLNSYAVFGELAISSVTPNGRTGLIMPLGIATDDNTKLFFAHLIETGQLVSLWAFENESFIFPAVHHSFKFCLLVTDSTPEKDKLADFVFFCRDVADIREDSIHCFMGIGDIRLINPNTKTCPTFRRRDDFEIIRYTYQRFPIISPDDRSGSWNVEIHRILNPTDDSELMRELEPLAYRPEVQRIDDDECVRVYEAKMIHQFDHRFGTYVGQTISQANQGKLPELSDKQHLDPTYLAQPRHWISRAVSDPWLDRYTSRKWILAYRDITSAVVFRTCIAAIIPRTAPVDPCRCVFFPESVSATHVACFLGSFNSFIFDFVARQSVSGTHLAIFVLRQLPVPTPSEFRVHDQKAFLSDFWFLSRVLELTYTAWDIVPFANDCGYVGPPFIWDTERRFLMRAELDAAFFHLYFGTPQDWKDRGTAKLLHYFPAPRNAVSYIMDSFRVLREREESTHGKYRTKELILTVYDNMAEAVRAGQPYQTHLDPPPGPPVDENGNFLPLPEWKPGQTKPVTWPPHIHPPKGCDTAPVMEQHPVFTIGHSNVPIDKITSLLQKNGVQVLVDVRSVPYSSHIPEANREKLEEAIKNKGIKYLFMGDQLGGRPKNVEVRDDFGNYDYSEFAATESFKKGIERLIKGAREHRICLLCSEEDPVKCHRGLLISRELVKLGLEIRHIRHGGKIDSQANLEQRIPPVQKGLFSEKQQ